MTNITQAVIVWCNKIHEGTSLVTVRVLVSSKTTRHMTARKEGENLKLFV